MPDKPDLIGPQAPSLPRSNQALRAEATERMLDTAARLIAEHGASKLSLADVGRESGYSHALPNYYFKTKTVLLLKVYESITKKASEVSNQLIRRRWPKLRRNGMDLIEAKIRAYMDMAASDAARSRAVNLIWAESYSSMPALQVGVRPTNQFVLDGLETELRAGLRRGEVDPAVDVASVAVVILALLRGVVGQKLLDPSRVDLAQTTEVIVLLLRRGLAPPAATADGAPPQRQQQGMA